MKFHYTLGRLSVCTLLLAFLFTACVQDAKAPAPQDEIDLAFDDNETVDLSLAGFEDQIADHVDDHGVDLNRVEEIEFFYPDGTSEPKYLLEGDIVLSKGELQDLIALVASGEKQYRTNNLVSPQTVTVIGYTGGGGNALTSKMRTALSWAVANYNALPLNLNFTLSFSSSTNADIVVYRQPANSGAGGSAGFPSGGNPYKWVQIYTGTDSYNTNVIEHVMTHEMGHCLGLRHTDYTSRASCGENSNEGSSGVGAVHIPGTPTGIDWNSIMLACFGSNEDGEFGYYDRVALEYLY